MFGTKPEEYAGMDAGVSDARAKPATTRSQRSRELWVFLLLAVLIWPFIAVGVVAGWGFLVWMYYLFTGPPGPV
jgi:periplasmic nitrate reductase NapE